MKINVFLGSYGNTQHNASILDLSWDEPDTDQPSHIVPGKTSIRSAIPPNRCTTRRKSRAGRSSASRPTGNASSLSSN